MSEPSARVIEELTLNAWPPLEILLLDGWILGFADGYTRRANSVQPACRSTLDLESKIAWCQTEYARRGLPLTFKITSAGVDPDLDGVLERLDFTVVTPSSVQVLDLAAMPPAPQTGPARARVTLSPRLEPAWLDSFDRLSGTTAATQKAERRLLEKIVPPHCFASLVLEDEVVAVGLAVAEHSHVGLFDIVVNERVRGQGLGRRLCTELLRWGVSRSAHTAYLAVVQSNAAARHLYRGLGFRETYTYWYRVSSRPTG